MSDEAFKNVTVQLPPDLLTKIDAEAERLDLNRSQYFRRLIRREFEKVVSPESHVEQQPQPEAKAA